MSFIALSLRAVLVVSSALTLSLPTWANAAEENTAAPSEKPAEAPQTDADTAKKMKNARVGFGNNCGRCHENFGLHAGPGPKLAGIKLNKEQIVQTITNGRNAMPSFKKTLTVTQIESYADYILSLKEE